MNPRRETIRAYVVIGTLILAGIASAAYVLSNQGQGLPVLEPDAYRLKAEVTDASGVTPGIGQPVNVAGVEVGQIVETDLSAAGNAVLTLEIERDRLPKVYANATAVLAPVTPLKDMSLELQPGRHPAPALPEGATIDSGNTVGPVGLDRVLAALDADTRVFLDTLIGGLDRGTQGRGEDLRRMLTALGPTADQLGELSDALAGRRRALARLVHNVGAITRAATRDHDLATVVAAGNQTLGAIAEQEEPLREAIRRLPATLRNARTVLDDAARLGTELQPTLDAIDSPVERLPATLRHTRRFSAVTANALERNIRPFVREVQPLVRDLGRAVPRLSAQVPDTTNVLQHLNHFFNELAYNAPGDDEGFLYWASWFAHNWNSLVSVADAHGGVGRVLFTAVCRVSDPNLAEVELLIKAMLPPTLCPPE